MVFGPAQQCDAVGAVALVEIRDVELSTEVPGPGCDGTRRHRIAYVPLQLGQGPTVCTVRPLA
jgi:hypothetical protein